MLEFDNVCFQYEVDDYAIMDKLSFQIQDGEFVCVIGPSGCGKSTIFRLVNKLLTPDAGRVLVNGQPIETQKNYCGYMPQHDLLFPWRTVRENVMLPMEIQGGYSKAEMQKRADEALASVGLSDWGQKSPRELSGGMRQRVGIAMAMTFNPELLLADEPTSALDVTTQAQIVRQMMELRDDFGTGIIIVTHNIGVAAYMADQLVVMQNGKVVDQGTRDEVMEHPTSDYTKKLLAAVPEMEGQRYV